MDLANMVTSAAVLASMALPLAQVLLVAAFSLLAFRKGWLTIGAAGAAFALGAVIVLATNFLWLFVLVSLLGFTALATRFRFQEKQARGVAEGKGGARRVRNVLANGLVPMGVAAFAPFAGGLPPGLGWEHIIAVTYVSAVAAAGSDTLASELGGLSDRVYMITSGRRVVPGTDGGVSSAGQGAALLGAALIALAGLGLMGLVAPLLFTGQGLQPGAEALLIPTLAGFVGCQVDSLFGGTLEIRGLINKEEVNLLGILAGAGTGFGLAVVL
jgi:uncharacterized protein (TIGR00297 family)